MSPKISPKFYLFVAILVIASLACSFGYNPQTGVYFQSGGSDTTPATAAATAESPVATESAPAAQAEDQVASLTYKVSGDTVTVSAGDKVIAKIKFVTHVDNMPTEWLRDRTGVGYLYQSGIGNQVQFEITLYEGGAFALDGDYANVNGSDLGVVNNPADFMAFADGAGTYKVTASSFGLAVGPWKDNQDKAGFVYADRLAAINNDGRPVYWLDPTGAPKKIGN